MSVNLKTDVGTRSVHRQTLVHPVKQKICREAVGIMSGPCRDHVGTIFEGEMEAVTGPGRKTGEKACCFYRQITDILTVKNAHLEAARVR